jgi:2,3-bisphosphoglycerate-dependent phosphoglycerate mutase
VISRGEGAVGDGTASAGPAGPVADVPSLIDAAIAAATGWHEEHLELILLRHGQPLPENDRGPGERLDPPLSALGRRQAEAAARALAGEGIDVIHTSGLSRARGTAQIIADRLGATVRPVAALAEVTVHRDGFEERAWRLGAARFTETGRWDAFPGHDPAFRARVRSTLMRLTARRTNGTMTVVCHSGVINVHLADALGLDRDYFLRPAHASITRVHLSAGRWTPYSVNETAHLRPDLLTA